MKEVRQHLQDCRKRGEQYMYCPTCLTSDSRVIETTKLEDMTLRYRECKSCKHRFFTKEIDATPEEVRILFNFRKKQRVEKKQKENEK